MPKRRRTHVHILRDSSGEYKTDNGGKRIGRYISEADIYNNRFVFHVEKGEDKEAIYSALRNDTKALDRSGHGLLFSGFGIGIG